jgi:hypothetical protein
MAGGWTSRSEYPKRAWQCECIILQKDQVLPDVDEGARVGCSGGGSGGGILRSPSSPTINVSDPKVNWVLRGNFMSNVQGAMVFTDGS